MKKKSTTRIVSFFLALVFVLSIVPAASWTIFARQISSDSEVGSTGNNAAGLLYNYSAGRSTFNSACASGSGYQFVIISTALGEAEFTSAYNTAKAGGKKVGVLAVNIGYSVIDRYLVNKQIDLPIFFSGNNNLSSYNHNSVPGGYYDGDCNKQNMNDRNYICGFTYNSQVTNSYSGEYTFGAGYSADNPQNHEIFFPSVADVSNNWQNGYANIRSTRSMDDWANIIERQGKNGFSKDEPTYIGDDFYAYINVIGNEYDFAKTVSVDGHGPNTGGTDNNIVAANPNYTDNKQVWKFEYVGDNYYKIKNVYAGEYINVNSSGTGDNTKVCTAIPSSTENAYNYMWRLIKNDSNKAGANVATYYLRPRHCIEKNLNMDLNVYGTEGKYLRLCNSDGGGNTQFYIYKINEVQENTLSSIRCKYDIETNKNNTCIGVDAGGTTNVCYRTYYPNNPSYIPEQTWRFERTNATTDYPPIYRIKHEKTGKYLQVDTGTGDGKTDNIIIADKNEDNDSNKNQKWILLGDNLSSVNIVPVCFTSRNYSYYAQSYFPVSRTDVVLNIDTPDAKTATGDNIQCGQNNFHDAQKFRITYEAYPVDFGDFYSPLTLSVPKASEHYAISLSQDGKNSSFQDYSDSKDGGVNIRRISDTPAVDQQWYFKSLGDGTYAIQSLATGYYIYNTGSDLRAYKEFKDENKFKWYIAEEPEDSTLPGVKYYSLRSKENFSKAFEVYGATTIDGGSTIDDDVKVIINDANHSPAQGWVLDISKTSPAWGENLGDTFWAYISPSDTSNKYLQCTSVYESAKQLKFAVINDDLNKRKQENYWKFERNNDGSYKISSCCVEGKIIDADGAFKTDTSTARKLMLNGEKPYTDTYKTYNQRWFIRKYARGYVLESKMTGQVLTINADDSASVARANENHTDQLFNITKTDLSVSSDLPNVKMRLFNYGKAINSADGAILPFFNGSRDKTSYVDTDDNTENYNMGDVKPTMSKTLVDNYPYIENSNIDKSNNLDAKTKFTKTNGSLKYLFDDSKEFVQGNGSAQSYNLPSSSYKTDSNYQSQCFTINNPSSLFKKNSETGLYYYDSLLNAAYFNRDANSSTGNFKLFDYTMSVPKAGYPYQKDASTVTGISAYNGNFYPFNIAHEEGDVSYGDLGNRQTIPATNEYVKAGDYAPVNYSLNGTTPIDCWFGMTIETEFEQTSDGTYDGKPVQFNFEGDDDVWVYIDDVLVLDIGGTHGALEGTINFQTGEVKYPTGTTADTYTTTSLRTLFEAAGVSTEDFNDSNSTYPNTFKTDTKHKLNFYYMERGGVISYCKINFNLPKGTPSVTKEVVGSNSKLTDNTEYEFKLEKAVPNSNNTDYSYQLFSDVTYLLENADGSKSEEKELDADTGIFKLKAGQTAYFHNIDDGTQYRVTELACPGVVETSATYTRTVVDSDGKKTVYTENMDAKPGGSDYVSKTYKLETNVSQNITFKNSLETTSLNVVKEVRDKDGYLKETMPDSVYNFGLRVYKYNKDGSTSEYGTIEFSIPGNKIGSGNPYTIDGLPSGAYYDLWEYSPTDFTNFYDDPNFEDSKKSGTVLRGKFVDAEGSPSSNDGITGTLNDNTVTVTNNWVSEKQIIVRIKYYDRNVVNGKPADINKTETVFSYSVTGQEYLDVINGDENSVAAAIKKAARISQNAGESYDNVIDEYVIWTSLKDAKAGITTQKNLHTNGNYAESEYHTDCYGYPQESGEKWVTYKSYQNASITEDENGQLSSADKKSLQEISVWLFNKPKTYTVTYYEAPDNYNDTQENAPENFVYSNSEKELTGIYYNQRLGDENKPNEDVSNHLKNYGVSTYTTNSVKTAETIKINNTTYTFKGWAVDADGKEIVSSDILYKYRVTKDITLYPVYNKAESDRIGLCASANSIDLFGDRTLTNNQSVQKTRLNTMLNPYGCVDNDTYISKVAVVYVTDAKGDIAGNKQSVQAAVQKTLADNDKESSSKGVEFSNNISGIGKANYFVHLVGNSDVNLTSKNRVQFTTTFDNPVLKNKKFAAFVAMKYKDSWIVSDNYIYYQFDGNSKSTGIKSVAVN